MNNSICFLRSPLANQNRQVLQKIEHCSLRRYRIMFIAVHCPPQVLVLFRTILHRVILICSLNKPMQCRNKLILTRRIILRITATGFSRLCHHKLFLLLINCITVSCLLISHLLFLCITNGRRISPSQIRTLCCYQVALLIHLLLLQCKIHIPC